MGDLLSDILAQGVEHLNIILLMGLAIFFGTIGAGIFQKLHIPRIIGYVTIGIVLGPVLKIISPETVQNLELFNMFALGIIGFLIGGELKRDVFTKFGRQVIAILLFEGGAAFLLVTTTSFFALHYFTHYDWHISLAMAVVFGAICAATDPASTVNVLWEYKSRGPLTTMLTAIVALDDALALVLYIVGVSLASFLTGHREVGVLQMIFHSLWEVVGSLGLGAAAGMILRWIAGLIDEDEKTLIFTISTVILTIGLAIAFELDVILSSMACGVTLINFYPRRSLKCFELVRKFAPPVYVLFFVIIGARLRISLDGHIWLLAGTYVIGSIVGEAGLNITEDDLIKTYKVSDVMETDVPVIPAGTPLSEVIKIVSDTDNFYYPVVDSDKKLIGGITLSGIRNTFTTQELNDWLVALDIVEPVIARVKPDAVLSDAFDKAARLDLGHLPVVAGDEDNSYVGVLNCRAVRRQLAAEVLSRQQKADSAAGG